MNKFDDFFDSPRTAAEKAKSHDAVDRPASSHSHATTSSNRSNGKESDRRSEAADSDKRTVESSRRSRQSSSGSSDSGSSRGGSRQSGVSATRQRKVIEAKIPSGGNAKRDDDRYDSASFESDSGSDTTPRRKDKSARSNDSGSSVRNSVADRKDSASTPRRSSSAHSDDRPSNLRSVTQKDVEEAKRKLKKKGGRFSDDSDVSVTDDSDSNDVVYGKSSTHSSLRQPGSKGRKKHVTVRDIDHMETKELNALLKTVLEMDREADRQNGVVRSHSAAGRSRTGLPPVYYQQRKNYSFNNDRVRQIEVENQRLLKQIIDQSSLAQRNKRQSKFSVNSQPQAIRRPTSASLNRLRELERIDAENIALLKRLQVAKPSKTVQRDVLVNDYHHQMARYAGNSGGGWGAWKVGTPHSRPASSLRPGSSKSYMSGSSSVRPKSGKSKPDWQEGW